MSHYNLRCDGFTKFFHDALALVSRKPHKVDLRDEQEMIMDAEGMREEQERVGEDVGKCAICTWTGPEKELDMNGLCPSCADDADVRSDLAADASEAHDDRTKEEKEE